MGILCNNCQNLDGFSSGNYCSGNNVVRDYRDGYCAANVCVSQTTQQVQQQCNNANQACQNGNCNTIVCSDGTLRNQCSSNRPLYCNNNLNLANNCNTCGCPSGQSCNSDGSCSVPVCQDTSWNPIENTVCSGQSFTQTSNCGKTRAASGTKSCAAELRIDIFDEVMQGTAPSPRRLSYNIRIREINGVDVTINNRQKCFVGESTSYNCQTVSDIGTLFTDVNIPGGGSITTTQKFELWTDEGWFKKEETFYGMDRYGNSVSVYYEKTI